MQAPAIDNRSEYITTTDASRLAEKSAETIRYWANTGRLPVALRLASGMRLFRPADVLRAAHRGKAA